MPFYRKTKTLSATQPKENEEATVSRLTMVRGRHYSPTMVLPGTDFLLFSCSMGVHEEGQNTSNKGHILGKKS